MTEKNKKNRVNTGTLNQLSNQQRIDAVIPDLIGMMPKTQIINKWSTEWGCSRETVRAVLNEALVWLATEGSKVRREGVRSLNNERLEELFGECVSVKEKLKVLDMINRLWGIYDNNIVISNKDSEQIKFNIGTK